MGKINIGIIAKKYINTLRNNNGRISLVDLLIHFFIPVILGILVLGYLLITSNFDSIQNIFSNAIMAVSIVASLLCAFDVMLFQLRLNMGKENYNEDEKNKLIKSTSLERSLIDETFFCVLWAIIVGFSSVAAMVLSDLGSNFEIASYICSAIAFVLIANFAITTCMCLKRFAIAYLLVSKVWTK